MLKTLQRTTQKRRRPLLRRTPQMRRSIGAPHAPTEYGWPFGQAHQVTRSGGAGAALHATHFGEATNSVMFERLDYGEY